MALAATLKLVEYIVLSITTNGHRKACGKGLSLDVPITYQTAWWVHQDKLELKKFTVEVVKSDLNLMDSESLILYTIEGDLSFDSSEVSIHEIHISERVNRDATLDCDRIFELTPIVRCEPKKEVSAGRSTFKIKNQHCVKSTHWGINRVLFICGDMQQRIELMQRK